MRGRALAARAVLPLAVLSLAGAQQSSCWHGDFNAKRCCEQKDPECWDGFYTKERCCPLENGSLADSSFGRGDPSCWLDGYSFDDCCGPVAKEGCWDTEFGPERCCKDVVDDAPDRPLDVLQESLMGALVRLSKVATDGPLGCAEKPGGFWRSVKVTSMSLNVSRSFGHPGNRLELDRIIAVVLAWTRDPQAWRASKAECAPGALNAIDLVASPLEREAGTEVARAAYRLHDELVGELVASGNWPIRSDWPILADSARYSRKLLGFAGQHGCHGTPLRIFMYDVEKLRHMTSPVLVCSQKMPMCTASVHLHRWLSTGSCLTDDPEKADLFWVPAYESCYNETTCGFDNNTQRCFPQDFDPTLDLQHFPRRRGADHVFVFGCNLLPFRDPLMVQLRQAIMVTVESYQAENLQGPSMLAWLSHWKDVLIPGYIPEWRIDAMLAFNRPVLQRNILIAFHGHGPRSKTVGHMYKQSPLAAVRDRIVEDLFNTTGCSVGPPVDDYFRRMGKSRFCLVPAGLTAWTVHLYEAFFCGCVPVILSDEVTVPFQREIDWPSLSIQVPTNISMDDLYKMLSAFRVGRLKRIHRALGEARCWFDYSRGWGAEGDDPAGCSPYRAMMDALSERARLRDTFYPLPRFWSPPPGTD